MYSQPVQAAEEYSLRLKDCEFRVTQRETTHIRLGNVRLVMAW